MLNKEYNVVNSSLFWILVFDNKEFKGCSWWQHFTAAMVLSELFYILSLQLFLFWCSFFLIVLSCMYTHLVIPCNQWGHRIPFSEKEFHFHWFRVFFVFIFFSANRKLKRNKYLTKKQHLSQKRKRKRKYWQKTRSDDLQKEQTTKEKEKEAGTG